MSMFFPGLILLAASNVAVVQSHSPNVSCAYLSALAGEAQSARLEGQSKTEADARLKAMQSDTGLANVADAQMRHDLIDHAYAYFETPHISWDQALLERYVEGVANNCIRQHRSRYAKTRLAAFSLR